MKRAVQGFLPPLAIRSMLAGTWRKRRSSRSAEEEFSAEVATRLLRYLAERLGVADLHYAQIPTLVPDGWETSIYHFQLRETAALPTEYRGPLTLRLFAGSHGIPRGRHELAVVRCLRQLGYPVPGPVCWEEASDVLGGPFFLMEQIPGPTLLHRAIYRPWTVLSVVSQMTRLQHWLHQLPTENFPCSAGSLLERSLEEMMDTIRQYDLARLTPGWEWLSAHRPAPPRTARIVHLDFHPLNLIHRQGQPAAVLDWTEADVGDPHADIATTLMLTSCIPNVGKNIQEQFAIAGGRDILKGLYYFACRRRMNLDTRKLAYYQAWAALRRLCKNARCLHAGPQIIGAKPSLLRRLRPGHMETLCRYFYRLTGAKIRF